MMIFMRCRKCNSAVSEEWSFCPACGRKAPLSFPAMRDIFNIGLEDVFERFMNRSIEAALRDFNDSGTGRESRRGLMARGQRGITVRIFRSANSPPVINVEQYAGQGQMNMPAMVRGASNGFAPAGNEPSGKGGRNSPEHPIVSGHEKADVMSKTVTEPKMEILRLPGKIVLEAELPGVESANGIKILELSESLEMRAEAPERIYLKIVQVPAGMRVISKAFEPGKLRVELGK